MFYQTVVSERASVGAAAQVRNRSPRAAHAARSADRSGTEKEFFDPCIGCFFFLMRELQGS